MSIDKEVAKWLDALDSEVEPWEVTELDNPKSVLDAFSSDLQFGTGGIRCRMGIGPNRMNRLTIGKATKGLAQWLQKRFAGQPSVAIGYDTRSHSREFSEVAASVLAANGVRVVLLRGPQPTPVLDFAVRRLGCTAGVCITASHNAREYNGYKVYGPDGVQATNAMAHAIQSEIEQIDAFEDVRSMPLAKALETGLVSYASNSLLDSYHEAVLAQRFGVDCKDLKVVYSPLCGTGLEQAQRILNDLGVSYSLVEDQSLPDETFRACPKPNPENPDAMAEGMAQMANEGADLFLATDPDADRVGVACAHGDSVRLLTGNEVGLLLFDYACSHGVGNNTQQPVAVTTIVSAPLADAIAEQNGVELRRTLTGFKYVGEQVGTIRSEGRDFMLGIEESDGYLRGSYVRDKDGICALMLVCELAAHHKARGMTLVDALNELYSRYGYVLDRQLSIEMSGTCGRSAMSRTMGSLRRRCPATLAERAVMQSIDYLPGAQMPVIGGRYDCELPSSDVLEWHLEGGSRVLLRPSGTEPKLKAYVFAQGRTPEEAGGLLDSLCDDVSNLIAPSTDDNGAPVIHVVLLSGGSGTRLWPLSNSARSKQFLKVLRDAENRHVSMVQRVFGQIGAVDANLDVTIATSAAQADILSMQVGGRFALAAEPERRDTAPAIMLACAHLDFVQGASEDDVVIVMPIDTFADQAYYDRIPTIADVVDSSESELVLLGVEPTYPSEKYGYILPASTEGTVWPVLEFREKPSEIEAASYIARGGLWNCGVFGFRLGWLRDLTRNYVDASSYDEMLTHYRELPKNSFDYEVVESAKHISVVPYSGTWKDLGTWNTLAEEMAEDVAGNVWVDEATVSNVHAVNETGLPLVVAGVSDTVVVVTPDGILVSGKDASSHIKNLVEKAASNRPMYERCQWGEYRIMDEKSDGNKTHSLVRELVVLSGKIFTSDGQRRCKRTWTVIAGSGEATINGQVNTLSVGSSLRLQTGQLYTVKALEELHIIEVQVD